MRTVTKPSFRELPKMDAFQNGDSTAETIEAAANRSMDLCGSVNHSFAGNFHEPRKGKAAKSTTVNHISKRNLLVRMQA